MKLPSISWSRPSQASNAVDTTVKNARASSSGGSSRTSATSQQRYAATKDAHKQHSTRGKISQLVSNLIGRNPARNQSRAAAFNPSGTSSQTGPSATRTTPPQTHSSPPPTSLPQTSLSPKSLSQGTPSTPSDLPRSTGRASQPNHLLMVGDRTWMVNGEVSQLKSGAFNTPSKMPVARDKGIEGGTGDDVLRTVTKEKVVKPEVVQSHRDYPIQISVGVTSVNANMIERNVATSIIGKELGAKTVPTSLAGTLNVPTGSGRIESKPVLAMSVAKGAEGLDVLRKHPGLINNPDFQRQMTDIETTAFLTGNPDNHMRNYMIHVDPKLAPGEHAIAKVPVKVTMIDNDMSFGAKMTNPDRPPEIRNGLYRHTGLPAYMDAETCRTIKAMDRDTVAAKLSGLDAAEVEAFKSRFDLLQGHVTFLEENNRVVTDWKAFTNAEGAKVTGDSYFKGTLEMSGVHQGDGVVVPRSMILRECQQKLGPHDIRADLAPHLSDGDREALAQYRDAAELVVPPSGQPHSDMLTSEVPVRSEVARFPTGEVSDAEDHKYYNTGATTESQVSGHDGEENPVQTASGQDGGGSVVGGGVRPPTDDFYALEARQEDEPDEIALYNSGEPTARDRSGSNSAVEQPPSREARGTGSAQGTDERVAYTQFQASDLRNDGNDTDTQSRANQLRDGTVDPEGIVRGRPRANAVTERPTDLDMMSSNFIRG